MPAAPDILGNLFTGETTVGDFAQLATMTFAASSGYSLVGSDVAVCVFLGRVSAPTFRIDYETADVDWDTGTGELDVTIAEADWSTFAPSNPVTMLVRVQVLIPDASPVTFWGEFGARPRVADVVVEP